MKVRLRSWMILSVLFVVVIANAQTRNKAYLLYIDQYHQLAEKQQKEHGIPASIVLAQGLLESGAGQSVLSKASNNHFGIKCAEWLGEKTYYDDDSKGECFRKYSQVLDSYEDHALFLRNRSRYASLFELKSSDYEGWAFGLKKAGYATDPTYAFKLISIIEDYDLHQFDKGKANVETVAQTDRIINDQTEHQTSSKTEKKEVARLGKKSTTRYARNDYNGSMGTIDAFANHEVKKVNGIKFVNALSGDSYSIIAEEFNMSEEHLRKYNDVDYASQLKAGARVFIAMKKNKAPKECLTHKIFAGESMRSIAQDYGVKVVDLYDLNLMAYNQGAKYGRVLKLR